MLYLLVMSNASPGHHPVVREHYDLARQHLTRARQRLALARAPHTPPSVRAYWWGRATIELIEADAHRAIARRWRRP